MGLVNKIGEMHQDNLISRLFPRALTTGVIIAALEEETVIKRGTLLAEKNGKYYIYGGEAEAKTATFSGDGTEKNFTVTDKPGAITVKVGGTETTDFTYAPATGIVAFNTAPVAGTNNIVVSYTLATGETPSVILADDTLVGTADETAVAYRSGNFNPEAVNEATGYAITEADRDTLRKYDIIFTQMI